MNDRITLLSSAAVGRMPRSVAPERAHPLHDLDTSFHEHHEGSDEDPQHREEGEKPRVEQDRFERVFDPLSGARHSSSSLTSRKPMRWGLGPHLEPIMPLD